MCICLIRLYRCTQYACARYQLHKLQKGMTIIMKTISDYLEFFQSEPKVLNLIQQSGVLTIPFRQNLRRAWWGPQSKSIEAKQAEAFWRHTTEGIELKIILEKDKGGGLSTQEVSKIKTALIVFLGRRARQDVRKRD